MRRILPIAVAACLLLPAAAVQAAKPPTHPAPVLTLSASPSTVTFGQPASLSGRLTGGSKSDAGVTITIQADTAPIDGHYANVATAVTDTTGNWHAAVVPTALTRYRAQAKSKPAATSPTADVKVRLKVTAKVSRHTVHKGGRVRFSGTAAPPHDGALVKIQRRTATGGWHTVAHTTLQHSTTPGVSTYAKKVRITKSGTYRVRVFPGDTDHLRGTSAKKKLKVA
jgi:hypothetical protein